MCPLRQQKYGAPRDGQQQWELESHFEPPHGTQQLGAMVAHLQKLSHKGDPSVHFMEMEQVGDISGCDDAKMAKLLPFSLDSRLYKSPLADSKKGRSTFATIPEEILEAMGFNDGSSFSRVENTLQFAGETPRAFIDRLWPVY
eukprot:g27989.t1